MEKQEQIKIMDDVLILLFEKYGLKFNQAEEIINELYDTFRNSDVYLVFCPICEKPFGRRHTKCPYCGYSQ